jgi:hypothetical protein
VNRATKLILLGTALAIAWQSNSAAAAPVEPPPLHSPADVPADWTRLVDDTNALQIAVPSNWTAIDLAPWHNEDGTAQPAISATTDQDGTPFGDSLGSWSVAGVQYQVVTYATDTASRLDSLLTLHGVCTAGPVQSWDDGVFAGHVQSFTDCGGTATRNVVVIANPADRAFTAVLRVQLTGQPDDERTLNGVLISFNRTAQADPPTTTDKGAPISTAATKPSAASAFPSPSGVVSAEWRTLVDDTQTVQIAVPGAWTEINLAPWTDEQGNPQPDISATTDEELFFRQDDSSMGVPGVTFLALPYQPLAWFAPSARLDSCAREPVQTYDDGVFVGHIWLFDNCAGTATRNFVVIASPADAAFSVLLSVQLTGQADDDVTLDGLLSSFNRVDASGSVATNDVVGDTLAALQHALEDQLNLTITEQQSACLAAGQLVPSDIDAAIDDLYGMPATVLTTLLNCGIPALLPPR